MAAILNTNYKKDYTKLSNGTLNGSAGGAEPILNGHANYNHNNTDSSSSTPKSTSALAKLKKKLQSFENPAYDRLREDGLDDLSTSSRTSSKILLDSTEDLNLRPPSNQHKRYRRRRKKCALVICVLILIVVICIIAALASYIATLPNSDTKVHPVFSNTTSSSPDLGLSTQTTHSIPGITAPAEIKVTNVLFCEMKVIRGQYSIYKSTYQNPKSRDFQTYEDTICNSVEQVFNSNTSMKKLYKDCSLQTLRNGSVLVGLSLHLHNNVSVHQTPHITYSINDIVTLFLTYIKHAHDYIILPGHVVLQKHALKIRPDGKLFTTITTVSPSTTATTTLSQPTSTVTTVSPEVANCTEDQFLCHSGAITLQHRRDYCIEQKEVCDGYKDCLLGEDEDSCGSRCSNGGFRCLGEGAVDLILNSQCTWIGEQCDGVGDCSDHSDEHNCTCVSNDFRCVNGTDKRNRDYCIPNFYKCDKENDCTDGSDEDNCTYSCKKEQFMCHNATIARPPFHGYCIEAHEVCDGHVDCLDHSDELGCNESCPEGKFSCGTMDVHGLTYCIPEDMRCDRVNDCQNNTDEVDCEDVKCPADHFECTTGILAGWPYRGFCLYQYLKCNGQKDCGDNSDEENCDSITSCKEDEFRCKNGTDLLDGDFCIPSTYLCDKRRDCSDGSDESTSCTYTCSVGSFRCATGTLVSDKDEEVGRGFCVEGHTRCDNISHCEDGSDEGGCDEDCGSNLFKCQNGTSTHTTTGHRCIPTGFKCDRDHDCTDGSDELGCNYTCPAHHWACKEKMLARWPYWGFCIWVHERCDGYFDCEDHSDEQDCDENPCSKEQFQCASGTNIYFDSVCIPASQQCDRHQQCLDGSDELQCNYDCAVDQFNCTDNAHGQDHCIPLVQLCDGNGDCIDGSDEDKCNMTCSDDQFRCPGGHDKYSGSPCIDRHMRCDKVTDCTDRSDETDCDYKCAEGMIACVTGTLADTIESGTEKRGFCIPPHLQCDGVAHCTDSSDEDPEICNCSENQFMCVNGTDSYSKVARCIPSGYQCDRQHDCTDGSDEVNCNYTCGPGKWMCASDIIKRWPRHGYCINDNERCDGVHDCMDLSDEKGCMGTNCGHERGKSFVCENGADNKYGDACIPQSYQCDRVEDCTDGSDEKNCTYRCEAGLTACKVGIVKNHPNRGFCLYPRDVCDGKYDCFDKSDEDDCDVKCRNDQFKCKSKNGSIQGNVRCIHSKWRCDGDFDCHDHSDEDDCIFDCKPEEEFKCVNGSIFRWPYYGVCIKKADVCDGYQDCDDFSDEDPKLCNKETLTCPPQTYKCQNESISENPDKACISIMLVCDRQYNCGDHSDEDNCNYNCSATEFMCKTSTVVGYPAKDVSSYCIKKEMKCDGIAQCSDGSDEKNCCKGQDTFRCFHGSDITNTSACIPSLNRCNGIRDCNDGSDEAKCENKNNTCLEGKLKCPVKPLWYYTSSAHWCYDQAFKCDQFVDCGDYSDEKDCDYTCDMVGEFQCGYKNNTLGAICTQSNNMCDGENDCYAGTDEDVEMCQKKEDYSCREGQIPCHNGVSVDDSRLKCVPLRYRCNGEFECTDGSDEFNC